MLKTKTFSWTRLIQPVLAGGTIVALCAAAQAGLTSRRPLAPPSGGAAYTLQWGDTLSSVASRFGTTVDQLAAANGIANIHRVQAGTRLTIPGPPPPPPPPPSSKLPPQLLAKPDRLALMPSFDRWAKEYKVPPDLVKALAWMESGWQNSVISPVFARGIGQLTPDTVKFVSSQLLKTPLDPTVADQNIRMSARFLRYLLDATKGDVRLALAAYYQGLGSVRRQGPLKISEDYVAAIVALRPLFA